MFDRTIPIYRQERTIMTKLDPTPIYTETVKDHPELFNPPVEEVHVGEPADEVHVR